MRPVIADRELLSSRRAMVWATAVRHGVFALIPVCLTGYLCWFTVVHHTFAVDFHHAFWPAGRRVLDGLSPYVASNSFPARTGVAFVYPAPGALFFAALALLPHAAADVIFTAFCICAALGVAWVLGVRDWRVYGLLLLWPPVISGWQTANLSLLLAFGTAAAWRLRERSLVSGMLVGVVVSLKAFMWPLGLWLLASRRYAALGWAVAAALMTNLVAWAILGFNQLHAYVAVASAVTRVEEHAAYTATALALHLGTSPSVARGVSLALAAGAAIWCISCVRRGNEMTLLLLAIVMSLLLTPIVWLHYFVLLIVPVAIARPRLSAAWILPLATFPCPVTTPSTWQLLIALGTTSCIVAALVYRPSLVGERTVFVDAAAGLRPQRDLRVALAWRGACHSSSRRSALSGFLPWNAPKSS